MASARSELPLSAFFPHFGIPLEAGMLITVHPMVVDDVERAFFADTYVVTEDGAERLNEIRPERDLPTV